MGQPILIMGANGGIGGALAQRLEDQGEDLILTARDKENLKGFSGQTLSVDVTDEESIEEQIGGLDLEDGLKGFAYCVGSINLKPFGKTSTEDMISTYELNTLGAFRVLKLIEPALKKANGSVVLFSTIAANNGFPSHTAIASAKGALQGLTVTLAAEWAPKVRVNCIAPSLSETEIAKPMTSSDQMKDAIAKMHPIPRLGKAEDSANLAAYLLSDDSEWMTGQILAMDGGRSTVRNRG